MSSRSVEELLDERAGLLSELGALSNMLHGSWVERYSVCSRRGCKCRRGQRHGPRRYLVVNEEGRQRQKYIPNAKVEAALRGIAEYHRVQEIVDRITHINLVLLKECDCENH
jgi:hypothetical protein